MINDDNFSLIAAKHYNNILYNEKEFNIDLRRFTYILRALNIYRNKNILKERIILNHIIILYNVFGDITTDLLIFKLKKYPIELKTFLLYLHRLPSLDNISITQEYIMSVSGVDMNIWNRLQKI